jgi:predicted site-specific integrase-resolvase
VDSIDEKDSLKFSRFQAIVPSRRTFMNKLLPMPAAQYLRMSTDHQQYSLDNQADAIARYAAQHGFQIVKTYSDAARSGLSLRNRVGLKQLLKDVVDGQLEFRSLLRFTLT